MVDLRFLEKFTHGDTQKMQRYIKLYLEVAPQTFELMQLNLAEKDWKQLRINAHSLKPQVDFMGIPKLKAVLIKMEETLEKNDFDAIDELFRSAKEISTHSENILKGVLK